MQAWASFAEGSNSSPVHPTAQGSAACLGSTLESSRDGNGRQHCVISASPVAYWKLLPNIPCHCVHTAGNSPAGTPSVTQCVTPRGWDTDGDTPELPSSFGFHRDGSALKCQRDQFSTCISLSMAMSWSAALDCCIGWRAVLHFITLGTHLDTSIEMRAVGAGTVQEQPP